MPRCYDCGTNVESIVRRTVKTGHSWGAGGKRNYYRKVNLCPDCAKTRDITKVLIFAAVAVILILAALSQN